MHWLQSYLFCVHKYSSISLEIALCDLLSVVLQAVADFMSHVMGDVSFNPSQLVLTCGATPAVEILCFCLADHGNAFLIPAPYFPGYISYLTTLYVLTQIGSFLRPIKCGLFTL